MAKRKKEPKEKASGGKPAVENYFAAPTSPDDPLAPSVEKPAKEMEADACEFEKKIGISAGSLKALFDKDPVTYAPKVKALVDMLAVRVKDGRDFGLRDYRVYAAIDEAYNIPYKQISPTLIRKIIENRYNTPTELEADFKAWGLDMASLYSTVKGEDGQEKRFLKERTFWKVFVPLVKAYLTIRQAKLFSDRDQYPFLKYEPPIIDEERMAMGDILTQLVQRISHQYGYKAVFRQALHNALKYGVCLQFPVEAWHSEETADTDGDGKHVVKEGLRYNIPHPTRLAWDMNHRLSTINTDTGCEWASYWSVCRYGDVMDNPHYWNKDKVSTMPSNYFTSSVAGNYFKEVFPCVMTPVLRNDGNKNDREEASNCYYQTSDRDKGMFRTDIFCKLTPSEWGIGEYKHPLWFRFVMANDDSVIYAEPLAYCPALYLGYDADENQSRNTGMALEILPWQDLTGNVLSQWLLSVKVNLKNVIPYDKDQVNDETMNELKATSEDVGVVTWLPYSSRMARAKQEDPSKMFTPISMPRNDISQFVVTLDRIFNIMERLLNMSASETGAAGAHIQTAEEIRVIATNVSTRLSFTGSFVDDYMDAWKRQLYYASRSYCDEEFQVQVMAIDDDAKKSLEKIGFEFEKSGKTMVVKGKRNKVVFETFFSVREGEDRINSPEVASVMLQTIQAVAKTGLIEQLGPEQMVELFSRVARLSGAPRDFRLRLPKQGGKELVVGGPPAQQQAGPQGEQGGQPPSPQPESPDAMMQAIAQMVQQQVAQAAQPIAENVMKQVAEGMKPLTDAVGNIAQQVQQGEQMNAQQQADIVKLGEIVMKLNQVLQAATQQAQPQPAPAGLPPQPGMM